MFHGARRIVESRKQNNALQDRGALLREEGDTTREF